MKSYDVPPAISQVWLMTSSCSIARAVSTSIRLKIWIKAGLLIIRGGQLCNMGLASDRGECNVCAQAPRSVAPGETSCECAGAAGSATGCSFPGHAGGEAWYQVTASRGSSGHGGEADGVRF
jgi:hypothetical protein